MVRLFPLSDLHGNFIDVNRYAKESPFNPDFMKKIYGPVLHTGDETILLACGDIGERFQGVMWCERMLQVFPNLNIVYCPGNHEFYGANLDLLLHDMVYADKTRERLHILDGLYKCKATPVDNMGRPLCTVIGGTLWTDFNKQNANVMNTAQSRMNDYKFIFSGGENKQIKATRILNLHYEMRKNIFAQIEKANKKLPLVCMSHHTPYAGIPYDELHYCYHTDLSENFNKLTRVPTYWFSGHTHKSEVHKETYNAGTVEFISNQIGYPHQLNTGFTLNCILEV